MSYSDLFSLLEYSCMTYGRKTAFIKGKRQVNYHQLWDLVKDNALILEKHGVGRGCRVLLRLDNRVEDIAAGLGVVIAGACLIPMPVEATEYERHNYRKTCAATHLLKIGRRDMELVKLPCEERASENILVPPVIMRPTSGTTGERKGVMLSAESVRGRIESVNQILGISPSDVVLWTLPVSFHLVVSILLYLLHGATIVLAGNQFPDTLISLAKAHSVTLLYGAPMQYRMLAAHGSEDSFRHLRWAISTGTFLMNGVADAFYKRFGQHLRQAYGLIEVGLAAINSANPPDPPESVGRAVPGHNIRICDETGKSLKDGEVGDVQLKGPGMFTGYVNVSENSYFDNGWFRTGDRGYLKRGVLFLKGRSCSAFHVAGMKVFPEEIEACLLAHEEVENVLVYSQWHPRMGDMVVADVVRKRGSNIVEGQLYRHCAKYLSTWKIPAHFNFVDRLEITSSGKVKRLSQPNSSF